MLMYFVYSFFVSDTLPSLFPFEKLSSIIRTIMPQKEGGGDDYNTIQLNRL